MTTSANPLRHFLARSVVFISVLVISPLAQAQPTTVDTKMIGEQVTGSLRVNDRISTLLAATAVDITRPDPLLRALLDGSDVGVRNTNAVVLRNGQAFYASGFRYANLIVENTIAEVACGRPFTSL